VVGTVPRMDAEGAREAARAAADALPAWRGRTARERAAVLRRWSDLVLENQDDLATILTAEQGKPLTEARAEVASAASALEWSGEEARRISGEAVPAHQADRRILVLKAPIGVVAALTSWGHPSAMVAGRAGPALAAGCTVVLGPAPATPFSALALAALGERAGLPPGTFNVVTGDPGAIGQELGGHPEVRKVIFTGSREAGQPLLARCAAALKEASLEPGGNAPFLVFDDADLEAAVQGLLVSRFRNGGQSRAGSGRVLVQAGVHDAFARRLAEAVSRLKVGDGLQAETQLGPLIDEEAVRRVEAHLADAVAKGARVAAGGARHPLGGCFFQPTVLTGATREMLVWREETLGPLAPLFRFEAEEEALQLASQAEPGLAACFYTRDLARAWRVWERLEHRVVGLNTGLASSEGAPLGGVTEPGVGRDGARPGLEDYLVTRHLHVGGLGERR